MIPQPNSRNTYLTQQKRQEMTDTFLRPRAKEINKILKSLGANTYDLWLPETREIPFIMHPDERITGIVYGRYLDNDKKVGRGAMIATDHRVLILDTKPLVVRCDEIEYRVISAVTYTQAPIAGSVTLHTRLGDFRLRTFNRKCAHGFVEAIEAACFLDKIELKQNKHWEGD